MAAGLSLVLSDARQPASLKSIRKTRLSRRWKVCLRTAAARIFPMSVTGYRAPKIKRYSQLSSS